MEAGRLEQNGYGGRKDSKRVGDLGLHGIPRHRWVIGNLGRQYVSRDRTLDKSSAILIPTRTSLLRTLAMIVVGSVERAVLMSDNVNLVVCRSAHS